MPKSCCVRFQVLALVEAVHLDAKAPLLNTNLVSKHNLNSDENMSNYDFSPRIPIEYTEPDCKFDKHHRRDNHHSLDNVYADCHSGKIWCPLCGAGQPAGTNVCEPCNECKAGSEPMLWLRGEVLRIRDAYVEQLTSEQPYLPDPKAHSYSQRKWIEALLLRQQCRCFLIRAADVLERTFLCKYPVSYYAALLWPPIYSIR